MQKKEKVMNQEQAKEWILDLWMLEKKPWIANDYILFCQSVAEFYHDLHSHYGELLSFTCPDDKWYVVNRWIQEYEGFIDA